jgi:hypothetical protein
MYCGDNMSDDDSDDGYDSRMMSANNDKSTVTTSERPTNTKILEPKNAAVSWKIATFSRVHADMYTGRVKVWMDSKYPVDNGPDSINEC